MRILLVETTTEFIHQRIQIHLSHKSYRMHSKTLKNAIQIVIQTPELTVTAIASIHSIKGSRSVGFFSLKRSKMTGMY